MFSSIIVAAQFLTLNWFFQGLEKMHVLTWLNLCSKLVFVLTVLIFVQQPQHYTRVNLLIGVGTFTANLIGLAWAHHRYALTPGIVSFKSIESQLRNG